MSSLTETTSKTNQRSKRNRVPTSVLPFQDGGYAEKVIHRSARRVIRVARLSAAELDDVKQDFFFQMWQVSGGFEGQRGTWEAFVNSVVSHAVIRKLRHRYAYKRSNGVTSSIDNYIGKSEPSKPAHESECDNRFIVSEDDSGRRLGRVSLSHVERSDLRADIHQVVQSLPAKWRIMLACRQEMSMQQVAREMGVPRTTLNGWMKKVRRRFESEGLKKYFEK